MSPTNSLPSRRVLLISGSLRHGSTNTAMLRTVVAIAPDHIGAELYCGISELPYFEPDLDRHPLPQQVQGLRDAVRGADAILICTPEYAAALPGAFKNLLEWLIGDEHPRSMGAGKPVTWINVSTATTGAANAHESLRLVLRYAGANLVSEFNIPVARQLVGSDGLIADAGVRVAVQAALDALVDATKAG
ncbi:MULTISPECIES: NADPH-dependent FMN reductase [unclassified Mycolicibacterium]|uniref:NADPH-dependent FMN reductase n=1 Tax=unclassified Mycolicibacterium TaxID=2636767 RepID=UPI0014137298|nr:MULTISPECIES: NADPH-dependent FMN reductase [unclassified Mycolicibacterium]